MRYENMPKGRNKDICVRCGKRANFADRLKSDVQYDLLCLAETTSSGYMTHGNVKLCGKCMSELLMWLDSEKPNNCEPQTYVINPQEPTNDEKCFECDDFFTCGGQCNKIEDEPQTERYCTNCKHNGVIADYECRECHGMDKHEFIEPQTERSSE